MPAEQIHYRGFYGNGKRIIFSYTVGKTEVLDMLGSSVEGGKVVFKRTLGWDRLRLR